MSYHQSPEFLIVVLAVLGALALYVSRDSITGSSSSSSSSSTDTGPSDGGDDSGRETQTPSSVDVDVPDSIDVDVDVPDSIDVSGAGGDQNIAAILQQIEQNQSQINNQQIAQEVVALLKGDISSDGNYIQIGQQQQQQQQMGGRISAPMFEAFMYNMANIQQNQQVIQQMIAFMNQSSSRHVNNQFLQQMVVNVLNPQRKGGETPPKIEQAINIFQSASINQTVKNQLVNILQIQNVNSLDIDIGVIQLFRNELLKLELEILEQRIQQIINFLVSQDIQNINNQVLIQIIEIVSGKQDGDAGRWQKFINTVQKSQVSDPVKNELIAIARMDKNVFSQSNVTPETFMLFRRVFNQIPIDRVEQRTKQMTSFINNNGISDLQRNDLINIIEFVRSHEPSVKSYKSQINYSGNMANDGSYGAMEQSVKQLIDEMKNEMKMDEQILKDDKEIIEDLGDALERIDNWRPIISDLESVKMPNNQSQGPEGFFHDMQAVVQAHQELQSPDASQQLMEDMQQVEADLKEILEDLNEKEGLQKKEVEQEVQLEKQLRNIENAYQDRLQDGIKKLKSYKGQN